MLCLALVLQACTPALNWREARLAGRTQVLMPCKPERFERRLTVASADVAATMLVCEADGLTWSATAFELPDDARRDTALREARHLLAMNLTGVEAGSWPVAPTGLTPSAESRRLRLLGQRPGGAPVQADALFVADGRWALQLVVLSPLDAAALAAARSGASSPAADEAGGPAGAAIDEFFTSARHAATAAS